VQVRLVGDDLVVEQDFVSLNGTHTNCAGGPTPWGSWLSCEETIEDDRPFVVNEENDEFQNGFEHRHGYVFEVPASSDGPVAAEPLVAMGRFQHEAVAIDPSDGTAYMTEDADIAGFYRFRSNVPSRLAAGGVLEMLGLARQPGADLRQGVPVGFRHRVRWVRIDEPDPDPGVTFEDAAHGVFNQGLANGAATFTGLEGCWWAPRSTRLGEVVFASTNGGDSGSGQLWTYRPDPGIHRDGGWLELLHESPAFEVLNFPDTLTVAPGGTLVVCEDGIGTTILRGITSRGELFPIAFAVDTRNDITGPNVSPDGSVLFFNIMGEDPPNEPAMTFAVWGPWHRGRITVGRWHARNGPRPVPGPAVTGSSCARITLVAAPVSPAGRAWMR
jgi:secreted PhoX family phosphatase